MKNKVNGFRTLKGQKSHVGDFVTVDGKGISSELPVKKIRYRPLKNGVWAKSLTKGLDKRTQIGKLIEKRRRELIEEVTLYFGAPPTVGQCIIIDRICSKEVRCKLYERGDWAGDLQGSRSHFIALENALRLDLAILFPDGLKKQGKKVLDLGAYLKEKESKAAFSSQPSHPPHDPARDST